MNYWQPAIVALRATYLPAYYLCAYKAPDIYVPIIYVPIGTSTFVENPLQIHPFYAKQTQFPKKSNERKPCYNNEL